MFKAQLHLGTLKYLQVPRYMYLYIAICPHPGIRCMSSGVNALTHTQPPVSYLILHVSTRAYNYNTYYLLLPLSKDIFSLRVWM
jgi:hypothetical protein